MSSPPSSLSGLAEGQLVAGKYRIVRSVGAGGMCTVFEAVHVHLDQTVALKVLKPDLAKDADCVARFAREARAAAQLRSSNVARVFDVDWLPEGQPYITMELLIGHDLATELSRVGRLPVHVAVDIVRQAGTGVSEAHGLGIVHRDLKPENLFLVDLGPETDRRLVKLLDFGIAKTLGDGARRLTAPDSIFGTIDYMSPEQIRSAANVDHRTDIWSLGVILYELLTGRTPFRGDARSVIAQIVSDDVEPPSTLVPWLPAQLVEVVMRALAKNREDRYETTDELCEALLPFTDLEPITAVMARLPPESVPRRNADDLSLGAARGEGTNLTFETVDAKRGFRPLTLAAALAVLGAGVVGGVVWKREGGSFESLRTTVSRLGAGAAPASAPATAVAPPPSAGPPASDSAAAVAPVTPPPEAPPQATASVSPPATAQLVPTSTAAVAEDGRAAAKAVRQKPPARPSAPIAVPAKPVASAAAQVATDSPPRLPRHL